MSIITAKVDFSPYMQIELPLKNINGTNIQVDWGDGSQIETFINGTGNATHSYTNNQTHDYKYEIIITGDITGLGDSAFRSNYYVEVNLPEGITTIGNYCFRESKIEQLTIPKTVTSIDDQFNYRNTALKTLTINGNNLTTIGTDFCFGASSLVALKLADSIINMGIRAFSACTSLKEFTVPRNLTGFSTFFLQNASLDLLKFNNGPISNPPINENTKIIVPLNKLQDFINHSSYPNDESRYDYYGTNISSAVYVSGKHMADKLIEMGVNASPDDGLTTLANKILQIPSMTYHQEIVSLRFNDDNNIKGSRPEQVPFKLCTNGEVVTGCLLPMDKTGPAPVITGYPDGVRYTVEMPDKDLNNNTLTYEWETYQAPEGYILQKPGFNDNTFMFSGLFEHKISLRIVDNNSDVVSSSDIVSITVKMNADYNPDGTEITLTKSDFIYDDGYYVASVQGFAYQSSKRLWTNVIITLNQSKYMTPVSQTVSMTKYSNGDTIGSATLQAIIAPTIDNSETSISCEMVSPIQLMSQYGIYSMELTLYDGVMSPLPNKPIKIFNTSKTKLITTLTTDINGKASFNNQDYLDDIRYSCIVRFEGDSYYSPCEITAP